MASRGPTTRAPLRPMFLAQLPADTVAHVVRHFDLSSFSSTTEDLAEWCPNIHAAETFLQRMGEHVQTHVTAGFEGSPAIWFFLRQQMQETLRNEQFSNETRLCVARQTFEYGVRLWKAWVTRDRVQVMTSHYALVQNEPNPMEVVSWRRPDLVRSVYLLPPPEEKSMRFYQDGELFFRIQEVDPDREEAFASDPGIGPSRAPGVEFENAMQFFAHFLKTIQQRENSRPSYGENHPTDSFMKKLSSVPRRVFPLHDSDAMCAVTSKNEFFFALFGEVDESPLAFITSGCRLKGGQRQERLAPGGTAGGSFYQLTCRQETQFRSVDVLPGGLCIVAVTRTGEIYFAQQTAPFQDCVHGQLPDTDPLWTCLYTAHPVTWIRFLDYHHDPNIPALNFLLAFGTEKDVTHFNVASISITRASQTYGIQKHDARSPIVDMDAVLYRQHEKNDHVLLTCPQLLPDGTWKPGETIRFNRFTKEWERVQLDCAAVQVTLEPHGTLAFLTREGKVVLKQPTDSSTSRPVPSHPVLAIAKHHLRDISPLGTHGMHRALLLTEKTLDAVTSDEHLKNMVVSKHELQKDTCLVVPSVSRGLPPDGPTKK